MTNRNNSIVSVGALVVSLIALIVVVSNGGGEETSDFFGDSVGTKIATSIVGVGSSDYLSPSSVETPTSHAVETPTSVLVTEYFRYLLQL